MKSIGGYISDFFSYKIKYNEYESLRRIRSKKNLRFLIWVRIITKIWMWLLALYLIANFASLMVFLLKINIK
jgi:hypothetical protein